MKKIIKLIINFLKKLFGINTDENKSSTISGDTANSGNNEENNYSGEPQITPSDNTEQEDEEIDCSKLKIIPHNESGNGGKIIFKTNL